MAPRPALGLEVRLPDGLSGPTGRHATRSASEWNARGVRDMDSRRVPDHGRAGILRPAGPDGPAFVVFPNFSVILRYNNAETYAIGIGHLSDRLVGGPPIRGRFPPDARGITIADRRELQARLSAAGFDAGAGARTRDALRAYQERDGLTATGEPTLELLLRLRGRLSQRPYERRQSRQRPPASLHDPSNA